MTLNEPSRSRGISVSISGYLHH